MRFSLLDRSRTRAGSPDGQALHDTISRAQRAESLGFHRFWVAEHHAVPGVASGSPAVLLAAIGQVTRQIRLGSGGVMLPQHQPFIVAEQFKMLESLYPGRIDLGIGRSLGFTGAVRRALRRETVSTEDFANDVNEVRDFLRGKGEVTARPLAGDIPLHLLATKSGITLAGQLGLPLVIGGPMVSSPELPDMLSAYRASFSPEGAPHVILALDVFVAEDEDRALELALPEAWAMAMSRRTGEFPPLESPEWILSQKWPRSVQERVEQYRANVLSGTAEHVASRLQELIDASGADEIMATTSTYDVAALGELDSAFIGAVSEMKAKGGNPRASIST